MTLQPYQYESLPKDGKHIRLLTVFPTRENDSDIIATLTVHAFPYPAATRRHNLWSQLSLPIYAALSYRWIRGKQKRILVNDKALDVEENVHNALRVMRYYMNVPARIWIDCICINQKDEAEKSGQIPLMPYIYGRAFTTLIWLGMPTEESKQAMNYVFRFTRHPFYVKVVDIYTKLMPFKTEPPVDKTPVDETPLAKLGSEVLRQGQAFTLRILLAIAWAVMLLPEGMNRRFQDVGVLKCYFQTLEEYKLSEPINEYLKFSNIGKQAQRSFQDGLQRGFQQARIHRLQQYATENGASPSEDVITQVASQRVTLVGSFLDSFRDGYRQGKERRLRRTGQVTATEVESAITVPPPMQPSTSKTINTEGDVKQKTWQPRDRALLSVDKKNIADLIERTVFSNTEYFSRMWTLQEVCVTGNTAIIHERNSISLADVLRVVQYLENELGVESELVKKAIRLRWINAEFLAQRRLPLRVLLYETRDRVCEDPKDKIYSLLGLMLERSNILIQPNCDKLMGVEKVYANATRFLIAKGRSLDIICGHEQQEQGSLELPSWTPDFTQFAKNNYRPLIDLSGRNTIYKASSGNPPEDLLLTPKSLPGQWQSLMVEGICLGSIAHLSSHISASESVVQRAQDWKAAIQHRYTGSSPEISLLRSAFELVQYCCIYCTNTNKAPEDLRVLQNLARSLRDDKDNSLCSKYLLTLICGRLDVGTRCNVTDLMNLLCQSCDEAESSVPTPPEIFRNAIHSGTANRRLFTTQNGDTWGAAPSSAELEDEVYVLRGCSVPVVLRHLGDRYELVGECYCQGVMDGEAEKNANWRPIVLG